MNIVSEKIEIWATGFFVQGYSSRFIFESSTNILTYFQDSKTPNLSLELKSLSTLNNSLPDNPDKNTCLPQLLEDLEILLLKYKSQLRNTSFYSSIFILIRGTWLIGLRSNFSFIKPHESEKNNKRLLTLVYKISEHLFSLNHNDSISHEDRQWLYEFVFYENFKINRNLIQLNNQCFLQQRWWTSLLHFQFALDDLKNNHDVDTNFDLFQNFRICTRNFLLILMEPQLESFIESELRLLGYIRARDCIELIIDKYYKVTSDLTKNKSISFPKRYLTSPFDVVSEELKLDRWSARNFSTANFTLDFVRKHVDDDSFDFTRARFQFIKQLYNFYLLPLISLFTIFLWVISLCTIPAYHQFISISFILLQLIFLAVWILLKQTRWCVPRAFFGNGFIWFIGVLPAVEFSGKALDTVKHISLKDVEQNLTNNNPLFLLFIPYWINDQRGLFLGFLISGLLFALSFVLLQVRGPRLPSPQNTFKLHKTRIDRLLNDIFISLLVTSKAFIGSVWWGALYFAAFIAWGFEASLSLGVSKPLCPEKTKFLFLLNILPLSAWGLGLAFLSQLMWQDEFLTEPLSSDSHEIKSN